MRIVELSSGDKKSYNHFVASHPGGNFLQSWEWGQWQESLGRQVFRFNLVDDSETQIGAVQLIKMQLFGDKYYLYAPYGPVVDLSFQIGDLRFLTRELQKKFFDTIFLRIEPQVRFMDLESWNLPIKKSFNIQPAITMVVDVNKSDEELLAGMHPKTRYNIKIAQRHGVVVESELVITPGHGLYVQQAVDLIVQTQERQKYRGHDSKYYHSLIDFFALHSKENELKIRIYKALHQKQLLACGIMVDFGKVRMYLYGGSSEDQRNVMAPYLMHFQAMQDAKKLDIDLYDLGGSEVAGGGERGFTRFKRGFGGRVVEYAGAYDVVGSRVWYTIYTLSRMLNRIFLKLK